LRRFTKRRILELYARAKHYSGRCRCRNIGAVAQSRHTNKGGADEGKSSAIAVQVGLSVSGVRTAAKLEEVRTVAVTTIIFSILSMCQSIKSSRWYTHEQIEIVASGTDKNTKKRALKVAAALKLLKPAMRRFALRSVAGTLYSVCVQVAATESISLRPAGRCRLKIVIANSPGRARTSGHASVAGGC
jgi:hypothetical protein